MNGSEKIMRFAGTVQGLYSGKKQFNGRKASFIRTSAVFAMSLAFVAVFSSRSGAGVATTKHNFGSMSPEAVKTTSTSEICIFCHAPHNTAPAIAMWNRTVPGDIYDIYASQSIVAAQGQPTGSSKLCLSCHDGTIAIGSLLNIPGQTTEPLGGTLPIPESAGRITPEGKIAAASPSYIGTNLRDDHPISFAYSLSYPSNVEIKSPGSFPAGMKLDNFGKLQCTTCHDPHGTNYTKFLVTPLDNAQLCTACHDQRYWNTMPAAHRDGAAQWNQAGVNPWHIDLGAAGFADDTPQMQGCLACHRSHGGAAGKDLLKGTNPGTGVIEDEEWTCLNCHNGNVALKNVEPEFGYSSRHDVKGYYGKHTPKRTFPNEPVREAQVSLGYNNSTNRHVECADCHNAHAAKSGNHTIGGVNGNIIGANLLGGWGIKVNGLWPAAGATATSFTEVDFITLNPGSDNLEGYLCMKCHSYYAYASTPPSVPSGNADGTQVYQSDITADFNINNKGFHPVFAQGKNRPPVNANPNWPNNSLGLTNTFMYGYYLQYGGSLPAPGFNNVLHTSTGACTDCHGSDVSTDPQGAHGSNQKWMLRQNETGIGTAANFCYNCHRRDVYGDENYVPNTTDAGGKLIRDYSRVKHPVDGQEAASPFYVSGADTGNSSNRFGILCLSCHGGAYDSANNVMKGIHGSNAAAGTLAGSDALGYREMNGACVESYARPSTTVGTSMQFRVVNVSADKVCTKNFTNFTNGNFANYNCNTIADCSN